MDNQNSCYAYGRKIKNYLDQIGIKKIETSFNVMVESLGLPDDAVGRIALFSVPRYRTNYDASNGLVTFVKKANSW